MSKYTNLILVVIALAIVGFIIIKPKQETPAPAEVAEVKQEETKSMSASAQPTSSASSTAKSYAKAGEATKAGKSYTAVLRTSSGDITIELAKETPITTNNFVFLAKEKFYDGVIFHRTIPGFMIQGGDPTGTGSGGPGYKFNDEKFTGEYKRGTVAMANAGPNTNGSQFFIMHADYALPPSYIIFGQVTKGLETVDKIATAKTLQDGRENSTPTQPVKITSIDITEK